MALVEQNTRKAFVLAFLVTSFSGCTSPGADSALAQAENDKMDCLTRCGEELERKAQSSQPSVARSQAPEVLPPTSVGTPTAQPGRASVQSTPESKTGIATVAASDPPAPPMIEGDTQVRIVASIGNTPIYESEIREAVYQRLVETIRLTEAEKAVKEKAMYREELRNIIEREMVIDDLTATLTARKQTAALGKLKEAASKEADNMVKMFKKERGLTSDEEFKSVLRSQGLTLTGLRRQLERSTMMRFYMTEKVGTKTETVELIDIREYYDSHQADFKAEESLKWHDIFVAANEFKTAQEAKQYAEQVLARAQKGEDFTKLAEQYGQGDTKARKGVGSGEKPGDIFPPEFEPTLLKMKKGQVHVLVSENGYHILKVSEHVQAGTLPLDEKLQAVIRKKVQEQTFNRERRRYIETLWKRVQPQIWVDY
jgi:peptidyl-prolyl cis-trans isomerase SurA